MQRMRKMVCLLLTVFLLLGLAVAASADQEPAAEPKLEITYKNLSYSSNIYVLYAVRYENVEAAQEIKLLFWDEAQNGGYLKGTEARAASVNRLEQIASVPHAVFYSDGVAPKELVDNQYCRAYVRIGGTDYYSDVIKYNPLKYIKDLTASGSAADRDLVAALRAYGAAAQTRFAYKTDDLASDEHYNLTLENAVLDDGFSYGLYKSGTTLNLVAVVPDGDSFSKWVDGATGTELGTSTTLSYTVTGDATVRAVMASDPNSCAHVYGEWTEPVAETCTTGGNLGYYQCSTCGRYFDAEYRVIGDPMIAAPGHEWEDVAAKPADCVPGWSAHRVCRRCELKEGYEEYPATASHTYVDEPVAPSGVTRGYTNHVCSACGDSYKSDYDYSLYSGVVFASEGKFSIPYNIESPVYTIEAAVQLNPSVTGRAGVIVGNYDGTKPCFNFEVYNDGRPRLFFVVKDGTSSVRYDYTFNTDIRSDKVKTLALTLEPGEAKLYVDGVLAETMPMATFDIPVPGRTLVLGGDNRAGNTQGFRGTIYSFAVFRDFRTEEELASDIILADSGDANCICSYNLIDSSSTKSEVVLGEIQESAQVTTVEELAYHASHGTRNIEIMNDITVDRTIYAISNVTIFSNGDYSLTRDPAFLSDMFVVGENAAGRNLILDNITCVLNLGKSGATGTLTIDGNKTNMNGDVFGALVYVNCSGTVNMRDGAVLTNAKKVANSRTLGMEQYYGNMVGGAAIVNINGTVNMSGGLISNCETNFDDPSNGDNTADNHLESCYGGAVFNNSNFVMTGGTISGNSSYYGGAIANFQECNILGGVIENNYTSHAGGAIYVYNADSRTLTVGSETGSPTDVIFRNNYTTGSSGGAIYSGANCSAIIYGGATFEGNHTPGSGGAVYIGSLGSIGPNTVFTGNHAGTGGAAYFGATSGNIRSSFLNGVTFVGNTAKNGGAAAFVGSNTKITNCTATGNTATGNGGAYYINRISADNTGATVTISGGTIGTALSGNTAGGEAGAVFADLNCTVSINGTAITGNTATGNGGAISLHGATNVKLTNVNFSNNATGTTTGETPVSGNGGAIYASYRTFTDNTDPQNPVSKATDSAVTATGCTFTGNHADGIGGAVMAISSANHAKVLSVKNGAFTSNTSTSNGGALVGSNAEVNLVSTVFTSNTAGGNGGAVYCNAHGKLTGNNNTFTGNASNNTQYGGGALYFTGATASLSDLTFSGNTSAVNGGAICVYTGSVVELKDTTATANTAGENGGFAFVSGNGSALTMTATSGRHNVLGDGTDSTLGNTATGSGGAIYVDAKATATLSDTNLQYNTAGSTGGAVFVNTNGALVMTGDSRFERNSSVGIGGAVYSNSANVTLSDTDFISNATTGSSAWYGGAIYTNGTSVLSLTDCDFTNNSNPCGTGGAICARGTGSMTVTRGNFSGNTAKTTGGAIHVFGITATITDANFSGNTATTGGAVMVGNAANDGSFLTISGGTLSGNTANGGGAVYIKSGSRLDVINATMSENAAGSTGGGAIYAEAGATLNLSGASLTQNTSDGSGGAIYAKEGVTGTFTNATISQNTATTHGGAMIAYGANLTLTGGTMASNTAAAGTGYGGAIYLRKGDADELGTINANGTTFSGNTAGTGGAFYVNSGTTLTLTDATLTGNKALTGESGDGSGGAIFVNANASVSTTRGSFTSNVSQKQAGAIYLNSSAQATLNGTVFTENSGETSNSWYGGAIYANGSSSASVTGCTFTRNYNPTSGGAICIRGTGSLTVADSAFNENYSKLAGAIYAFEGVTVNVSNSTFTGNYTTSTTGGAIQAGRTSNTDATVLTLTDCAFTSNTAKTNGGAVYLYGTGSLTASGTKFVQNTAGGTGGAIHSYLDGTNVSLTNCLFDRNTSTGNGGAIYHSAATKMTWTGVTVTGNSSSARGDAVYVTNGSGKTTYFTIYSAAFNQPSRASIDIGNNSAYVTVKKNHITDTNENPNAIDPSTQITGTKTHVTYEAD